MVIEKDKMVSISYTLRIDNSQGEIVEVVNDSEPLKFIFGTGMLLPKFESNLKGKTTGDTFEFQLNPQDAYGEYSNDDIVDLDIEIFKDKNGKLKSDLVKVGASIPMSDGQGNRLTGIVKKISETHVTMDFNHSMAGKKLFFSGKVVGVKVPDENDLAMFAPQGGCGSSCNSGCKGCD